MSTITTSLGRGFVPREPPQVATDVVGGAIINYIGSGSISGPVSGTEFSATSGYIGGVYSGYALSGGSTDVGGFWPMQAGLWSGTTDGTGQASVTFPYAFKNTPASVVATVEGSDYAVRIVSRATTGFTAKVLQAKVNWTSGAVLASGLNVTSQGGVVYNPVLNTSLYAASSSGGVAGSNFTWFQSYNQDTFVKSVTGISGVAVVSVSGFLTAAASVSVNIDWIAAA